MSPFPVPAGRRFDILAIGEPLYEFSQEPDGRFRAGFGGDTSNAAIAAARLGARAAYFTRLGSDMFGDGIAALWRIEGVDASHVTRDPQAPTGVYVITHDARGHHFTYLRKGSAASLIGPGDIPADLIAATAILHASGISQAIGEAPAAAVMRAFDIAREAGTAISYDTNFRPRLWPIERARPVIHAAAARADLLKTSLEDGELLTGHGDPETIAGYYLNFGAKAVAVTLGAKGALGKSASETIRLRPHAVDAIDATGAGDAFMGALLAEFARGRSFTEAMRFANAAAALATKGLGAVAPLPSREDVEATLKT